MHRILLIALLCLASAANADSGADLAQAKQAMVAIQGDVRSAVVNRLDGERRYAIWNQYYGLLEHLWRMQVHYEMMTRHGWDRRAEFDAARDDFYLVIEVLRELLPSDD